MLTVTQKLVAVAVLAVLNLAAVVLAAAFGGFFGGLIATSFFGMTLPAAVQVVRL